MKKAVSLILCAVLALAAFTGCSKAEELSYDVVLITDGATVTDGAYNESAWNGVKDFAEEAGVTYRYYQPPVEEDSELTTDTALKYIDLAADKGAKYIVLPSEVFEVAAFEASRNYPEINFILVNGKPHAENDETDAYIGNVMCVSFNSLQSGFLAGYNAVISGNTKLGYFGSIYSDTSSSYGAGFVQGAAYAADELGIPVTLDYADYDSPFLDFDYDFTLTANYEKIENINEECYVVKVENGTGSGTYTEGSNVTVKADPAPEGMVFDHWDYKSDTEGVKDKKVNLSTTKKTETNLLVEKCSCTITAVYKEAESQTYPVTVNAPEGYEAEAQTQYVVADASCEVKAPAAQSGMKFDHWEISTDAEGVIDDIYASATWVHISEETQGVTLTPVYTDSEKPTFNVTVVMGEGAAYESTQTGSYLPGDYVEVSAAEPMEGYIFTHWSNEDSDGYGAGIEMENEFYPNTSYEMVNRYQAVVEKMYDAGDSIVFAGGNDECNAVADATWKYSYQKLAIGAENWQCGRDNYFSTAVKDYASAVKACLADFKGGYTYNGDCSNNGIYMDVVNEENQQAYDNVYSKLASDDIPVINVAPGADVRLVNSSKCLTLNYWIEVPENTIVVDM
ncbi:MAG: BMP family ABC transporter substrate-binding protein [Eubacterium sp.]